MNVTDQAKQVVRSKMLKSVVEVNNDEDLKKYLLVTVEAVAGVYKKEINSFSIADIKRAVDSIYNLLKKFNLENVTLKQVQVFGSHAESAGDIGNIITFAESVAGLVHGNFGWLLWHISKNLATPRIKRATAVYIVGHVASVLYGGEIADLQTASEAIDPIFESMNRERLVVVAGHLGFSNLEDKSDLELIKEISIFFKSEGKDQGFLNAWFPKDASSYLEVLVVVAKKKNIDIRGLGTAEEIESAICSTTFKEIWDELTPEIRESLTNKINENSSGVAGEYIFSAAGVGTIGLAQLSGFGVYSTAAALLGFLSSSAGVSLGFGAYTGLSTAIATAIGPAGAIVLVPAVFEYIRAKPERTLIGAIAAISVFRGELIREGKFVSKNKAGINDLFEGKMFLIATTTILAISLAISLYFNVK